MKKCAECAETRSLEQFHRRKRSKDGYNYVCKRCDRGKDYEKRYGIGIDEYERMLADQDGVCVICKLECRTREHLSVDHCHETGEVRGLLCSRCNSFIGYADEDTGRLRRAIEYLSR